MTDNEIIKALEHCLYKDHKQAKCTKCEYVTGCKTWLMRNALDLINRQRAEIERLEAEIEDKQFRCDSCDRIGLTRSEHIVCIKQAKAEAIKEFAERLKKNAENQYSYDSEYDRAVCQRVVDIDDIENLVKEMTKEARHEDNS